MVGTDRDGWADRALRVWQGTASFGNSFSARWEIPSLRIAAADVAFSVIDPVVLASSNVTCVAGMHLTSSPVELLVQLVSEDFG